MKVAVTYDNGEVFQHFGRTESFKVYTITDNKIVSSEIIGSNGNSHGSLAGYLRSLGVSGLICGGIGGGAREMLDSEGIKVYPGVSGNADDQINALISNDLRYDPDTECDHHDHEEEHTCTCGKH
ncbi:MAG: NifB/NifX family molybdenum-iron cluster-binding protein [Candidatus Methanomethylophilaceae archaeon]